MRMRLVVFVQAYRESVGSTTIMKIMFLISVILILLLQLCNAQLVTEDILDGDRHDRENQNKTSHSSENGGVPSFLRGVLERLNNRENQNNEPHNNGLLARLPLLTRGMDRGRSNRESPNNES